MIAPNDIRRRPLYTPSDIIQYAHVPASTLRTWVKPKNGEPLLIPAESCGIAPFSFINLIEAHVLVALRKLHRVPMQRVRRAAHWLGTRFGTEHPLAEIDLETDGYDLFVDHLGNKVVASCGGRMAIRQIVTPYLRRIERERMDPVRFYPFTTFEGGEKRILMDPRVVYGRPVIAGTRIETVMVVGRFRAGEDVEDIAKDYDLDTKAVQEAIRCEEKRRAA